MQTHTLTIMLFSPFIKLKVLNLINDKGSRTPNIWIMIPPFYHWTISSKRNSYQTALLMPDNWPLRARSLKTWRETPIFLKTALALPVSKHLFQDWTRVFHLDNSVLRIKADKRTRGPKESFLEIKLNKRCFHSSFAAEARIFLSLIERYCITYYFWNIVSNRRL